MSVSRALRVIQLSVTSYYYKPRSKDITALVLRIKEFCTARCRYGYRRIHVLLRREGWKVNHKRTYRIYQLLGLGLSIRRKKKIASHNRVPLGLPETPNEQWTMDFMHDRLDNGRRFRILNILDKFTRECVFTDAVFSFDGHAVIRSLGTAALLRKFPKSITVDNGSEFYSRAMDSWAYQNGVSLDFIQPGKPAQNAFIESFNGKMRDEYLNTNIFFSIEDARNKICD